jgi:hypothetical protein
VPGLDALQLRVKIGAEKKPSAPRLSFSVSSSIPFATSENGFSPLFQSLLLIMGRTLHGV